MLSSLASIIRRGQQQYRVPIFQIEGLLDMRTTSSPTHTILYSIDLVPKSKIQDTAAPRSIENSPVLPAMESACTAVLLQYYFLIYQFSSVFRYNRRLHMLEEHCQNGYRAFGSARKFMLHGFSTDPTLDRSYWFHLQHSAPLVLGHDSGCRFFFVALSCS